MFLLTFLLITEIILIWFICKYFLQGINTKLPKDIRKKAWLIFPFLVCFFLFLFVVRENIKKPIYSKQLAENTYQRSMLIINEIPSLKLLFEHDKDLTVSYKHQIYAFIFDSKKYNPLMDEAIIKQSLINTLPYYVQKYIRKMPNKELVSVYQAIFPALKKSYRKTNKCSSDNILSYVPNNDKLQNTIIESAIKNPYIETRQLNTLPQRINLLSGKISQALTKSNDPYILTIDPFYNLKKTTSEQDYCDSLISVLPIILSMPEKDAADILRYLIIPVAEDSKYRFTDNELAKRSRENYYSLEAIDRSFEEK